MFEWVIENKEWLFSGGGIALLSAIALILKWLRSAEPGQQQSSGQDSFSIQVGGDARGDFNISITEVRDKQLREPDDQQDVNIQERAAPPKSLESQDRSPEERKRERDIENLKWLLSTMHLPSIDALIQEAPYNIHNQIFQFWERYNNVKTNSLFHLYDQTLKDYVDQIHQSWGAILSHGDHYHDAANPNVYIFGNIGILNMWRSQDEQKAWDEIVKSLDELRKSRDGFLRYLREEYLEINIEELNRIAWEEYIEFEAE